MQRKQSQIGFLLFEKCLMSQCCFHMGFAEFWIFYRLLDCQCFEWVCDFLCVVVISKWCCELLDENTLGDEKSHKVRYIKFCVLLFQAGIVNTQYLQQKYITKKNVSVDKLFCYIKLNEYRIICINQPCGGGSTVSST